MRSGSLSDAARRLRVDTLAGQGHTGLAKAWGLKVRRFRWKGREQRGLDKQLLLNKTLYTQYNSPENSVADKRTRCRDKSQFKIPVSPSLALRPWKATEYLSLLPHPQEQWACCRLDTVKRTVDATEKAARDDATLFYIFLPISKVCLIRSWLFIILTILLVTLHFLQRTFLEFSVHLSFKETWSFPDQGPPPQPQVHAAALRDHGQHPKLHPHVQHTDARGTLLGADAALRHPRRNQRTEQTWPRLLHQHGGWAASRRRTKQSGLRSRNLSSFSVHTARLKRFIHSFYSIPQSSQRLHLI